MLLFNLQIHLKVGTIRLNLRDTPTTVVYSTAGTRPQIISTSSVALKEHSRVS